MAAPQTTIYGRVKGCTPVPAEADHVRARVERGVEPASHLTTPVPSSTSGWGSTGYALG
jgi:hypothetical protein